MSQERANLVRRFRRKDVLELTSLLFDLRFALQRQAVGEEPFSQPVAADDVGSPLPPARGQFHNHAAVSD